MASATRLEHLQGRANAVAVAFPAELMRETKHCNTNWRHKRAMRRPAEVRVNHVGTHVVKLLELSLHPIVPAVGVDKPHKLQKQGRQCNTEETILQRTWQIHAPYVVKYPAHPAKGSCMHLAFPVHLSVYHRLLISFWLERFLIRPELHLHWIWGRLLRCPLAFHLGPRAAIGTHRENPGNEVLGFCQCSWPWHTSRGLRCDLAA